MKVFRSLDSTDVNGNIAMALGNFDGLHLGHNKLLTNMMNYSKEFNLKTAIVTFFPHPEEVLFNSPMTYITPLNTKIKILKDLKLDYMFIIPFSKEVSAMEPEVFVKEILLKGIHKVSSIFIGFNFRFGNKGKGNPEILESLGKRYNFDLNVLPPYKVNGLTVSSTLIKSLLTDGEIYEVNKLLGRPFSISGRVIHGDGLGRTMGFPTANLLIRPNQYMPKNGVYICKCLVDNIIYKGVLNLGNRPTFEGMTNRFEIHLIGFTGDLYNKNLNVNILKRIRDEKKFNSKSDLTRQITEDAGIALLYEE